MKLDSFSYIQKENLPHGKVILIGMMEDGPTGSPFILKDKSQSVFLLGDNEISRAYNVLAREGTKEEDIYLYRINGLPGEASLKVDGEKVITLQSMSSHSEENNIEITTSMEGISIRSNYSEKAIELGTRKDFIVTYRFDEYPYVSDLAEAITRDAAVGIHGIIADYSGVYESKKIDKEVNKITFSGASEESSLVVVDGEFKPGSVEEEGSYLKSYWDRFYIHVLGEAFDGESSSKLMDIAAEVMYFPDLPVDEIPELAILSGRAAKIKSEEQNLLCTVLFRTTNVPEKKVLLANDILSEDGMFFNTETGEIEKWEPTKERDEFVGKIEKLFTQEEKDFDEMKNIQIVIGEEKTPTGKKIPGANYHLINLINKQLSSTTNKELTHFTKVSSPLDKVAIDKLTSNGYICIVESIRRNVVTSQVKNLYNAKNFYDEYYFEKIISYISYDISSILEKYVGNSNSIYDKANIEELLTEYLDQYISSNILQDYTLGERELSEVKGNTKLSIELVIYGQVESISGSVQLSDVGWEVDLWSI